MQSLLPNLGILKTQLDSTVSPDQFAASHYSLELLPYSLGATYQAFFDFVQAERDLVTESIAHDTDKCVIHAIGPGGRDKLGYKVDSFLEAARRTQNAVIPYISKGLSLSLPASMNDLMKKMSSQKISLPQKLTSVLMGYWQHHGQTLKAYRDLSQHHGLVISDVRIFYSSEEEPAIHLTLPNNPEEKSPTKLVFGSPPIHAFQYMYEQLQWLIRFCHEVTTTLTKPPGKTRSVSSTIVFRGFLEMGSGKVLVGHHLGRDDALRTAIDKLVSGFDRI